MRSAGPDGEFADDLPSPGAPSDDIEVPRVPPAELGVYRALGWAPWILAAILALASEGLRWLRRPSEGLQAELLPTLFIGAGVGVMAGGGLSFLASKERALARLVHEAAEALVVPPPLAFGGSVGLAAALALLTLRLQQGPSAKTERGPKASLDDASS